MTSGSPRLPGLRVTALTPDLFDAWSELFNACASGCFCRYWHFEGTKNEWLERLALSPEANEREQRERVVRLDPEASGLVALDGGVAVGWMKLVSRACVPKLRRLPVYRQHDVGDDETTLSVACLLTRPSYRRQGVARALLDGAIAEARARRSTAIESYPHSRGEALRDEELWMGPMALYEERGFSAVDGGNPTYPVLRLGLHEPQRGGVTSR